MTPEYQEICALEKWRLSREQTGTAAGAIARLRSASLSGVPQDESEAIHEGAGLCAAMLDAWLAAEMGRPDAGPALERLDSIARVNGSTGGYLNGVNLVVARLRERNGDLAAALRELRRREHLFGLFPLHLSTYPREEGRVASLAGDTAGAIQAYQHYLALRHNPEPRLRAERDSVRASLGRLLSEPRGGSPLKR